MLDLYLIEIILEVAPGEVVGLCEEVLKLALVAGEFQPLASVAPSVAQAWLTST